MNPIDLELEAIQLDGGWLTRGQLVDLIKSKLDAKEYAVSKWADALAQLTSTLQEVRSLTVRVAPQLADAVAQAAKRKGTSEQAVLREALVSFFDLKDTYVAAPSAEATAAIAGRTPRAAATQVRT